jgi:hypothetical protein
LLKEATQEALDRGLATIRRNYSNDDQRPERDALWREKPPD